MFFWEEPNNVARNFTYLFLNGVGQAVVFVTQCSVYVHHALVDYVGVERLSL